MDLMCDALPEEAWEPDKTFLEPTCGEGVFVVEVLRRKFSRCKKRADFTTALRSVYAMELLPDNVEQTIQNVTDLCMKHFKPTKAEMQIINDHIIQADALKVMKMINDMNEREKNMSIADARSILLRVDHGESVNLVDYVDALKVCIQYGFDSVSAFLESTD